MEQEKNNLKEKIIDILRKSDRLVSSFRKQIENKSAFIFIGLTKSGKTTLVKYIRNQPLTAFQHGSLFKIKDYASSNDIGHSSVSNTTVPSVYDCDMDDAVIIDAPGFDDNRGVLQEIVNSLYINQIKYAREVKFILVSDINNITNDNINNFLKSIQTVQTILSNFDKLKQGVAIIFTKDNDNYTRQEIADMLRCQILQVDNLKCNKNLIQHLVNGIDLIGLFKMPTVDGILTDDIEDNIKNAIFTTGGSINLNKFEIKYGISTSARNVLLESYISFDELVEDIGAEFNDSNKITLSNLNVLLDLEFLISLPNFKLEESIRILELFVLELKNFENSKCVDNIPSDLKILYINKFSSILKELKNVISINEMNLVNEKSIDEIARKIEYIQCIELVIDLRYKTDSVLKLCGETLKDLQSKILRISKTVKNEIDIRKSYYEILPKLLESKMILLLLNDKYFAASTNEELSRMKIQLEILRNQIEHYNSEILKRTMISETLKVEIDELLSIIDTINEKELTINNVIQKATTSNMLSNAKNKVIEKCNRVRQSRGLSSQNTILDEYVNELFGENSYIINHNVQRRLVRGDVEASPPQAISKEEIIIGDELDNSESMFI